MKRKILNGYSGAVAWEGEAETVKDAIHAAMPVGANLRGANLGDAENLRLPTGETWDEYLTETVPALLTSGGKSLESFTEHWQCHDWTNCPIAHAFDAPDLSGVPMLLRPRAEQFIQLFDSKQI